MYYFLGGWLIGDKLGMHPNQEQLFNASSLIDPLDEASIFSPFVLNYKICSLALVLGW